MKTATVAALTALLSAGASAVPTDNLHNHKAAAAHGHFHLRNKRDIVWVTEWEVETVVVMKTVYADGSEPTEAATTTLAQTTDPVAAASSDVAPSSPAETDASAPAVTSSVEAPVPAPAPTTSTATSDYVAPPASTSTYVAPPASTPEAAPVATTFSTEAAPAPATTYSAPAAIVSTSAAAAAAAAATTQASSGSSSGATFSGDATYWEPALGACGWTNTASEAVVAISKDIFDASTPNGNPNNNPLCGKMINIIAVDGSTVSAEVVDRCVGCASGDLDMTKTLFDTVTGNGDGRVGGIRWSWA